MSGIAGVVMKAAPLGTFGAMAFAIGRYGIVTLLSLGQLMRAVYLTCIIFIVVVLASMATLTGAQWEGALDGEKPRARLAGQTRVNSQSIARVISSRWPATEPTASVRRRRGTAVINIRARRYSLPS